MAKRKSTSKRKKKHQEELVEIDPIQIGGYVKALQEITYEDPKLVIPQGTQGIVHKRKGKRRFLIAWPQDFNHPRVTHEKFIR